METEKKTLADKQQPVMSGPNLKYQLDGHRGAEEEFASVVPGGPNGRGQEIDSDLEAVSE